MSFKLIPRNRVPKSIQSFTIFKYSISSQCQYATKEPGFSLPGSQAHCQVKPFEIPSFPCLDALEKKNQALFEGPEPNYNHVAIGHKTFKSITPLKLDHGSILPNFEIAYETWGSLNAKKSNAILIHTGLSASSHARSHANNPRPGWWEKFIGPGLSIDTDRFFVICTNVLGGCYGSTGPSSIMPSEVSALEVSENSSEKDGSITTLRYATRFPILTIFDMLRAQFRLLDHLGIQKLHASVGASMGGMQSLAAGILFSERVKRIVTISACARSHPYSVALRHCQRQVLMTDPNWNKGEYYDKMPPHIGMKLAREIATITYRSGPEWEQRFGRKRADPSSPPTLCPDFLIETYLDHQSEKFCLSYDANSLLYISKAMDMFDLSASSLLELEETAIQVKDRIQNVGFSNDLDKGLSLLKSIPTLVLGVQSDILFPSWQQKEVSDSLRRTGNPRVHYYELDALYGHDTFLIDLNAVGPAIKGHLEHHIS